MKILQLIEVKLNDICNGSEKITKKVEKKMLIVTPFAGRAEILVKSRIRLTRSETSQGGRKFDAEFENRGRSLVRSREVGQIGP